MNPYLLIGLAALLGGVVQASTGFGFAIVTMSIWPLIMPFRSAVAVEVFVALVLCIRILWPLRSYVKPRMVLWPFIGSLILSPLGLATMLGVPESIMRRLLGGTILILAIYFVFLGGRLRFRQCAPHGLAAGVASGFFGGLLGMGGPPMVAYLLSVTQEKKEYGANLQVFFVVMGFYHLLLHGLANNITAQVLTYSAVGIVGVLLGSLIGVRIFNRMSIDSLRKCIYTFMAVFGVYLLIAG